MHWIDRHFSHFICKVNWCTPGRVLPQKTIKSYWHFYPLLKTHIVWNVDQYVHVVLQDYSVLGISNSITFFLNECSKYIHFSRECSQWLCSQRLCSCKMYYFLVDLCVFVSCNYFMRGNTKEKVWKGGGNKLQGKVRAIQPGWSSNKCWVALPITGCWDR